VARHGVRADISSLPTAMQAARPQAFLSCRLGGDKQVTWQLTLARCLLNSLCLASSAFCRLAASSGDPQPKACSKTLKA
jgi:hypothetical protein